MCLSISNGDIADDLTTNPERSKNFGRPLYLWNGEDTVFTFY